MRVYTAHMRRPGGPAYGDVHLIKEGFSWTAFLFTALWALWCRLWGVALAVLIIEFGLSFGLRWLGFGPISETAVMLAFSVLLGLFGNDLKRWYAKRRGYVAVGVVAASNGDAAAQRFFDQHPALAADLAQ